MPLSHTVSIVVSRHASTNVHTHGLRGGAVSRPKLSVSACKHRTYSVTARGAPLARVMHPQWLMKSVTGARFSRSSDCSPSTARGDRQVQWHWIPGTATLPPRSPGCDNVRALGPAGLVVGRSRGLGQGSLEEPERLLGAVGRESGIEGKRRRYSLTGTALRAHLLWAENGLGHKIPPGSRVLVAACRTRIASVRSDRQAAVRSVRYEKQHQLAAVRGRGHGAELSDGGDRVSE